MSRSLDRHRARAAHNRGERPDIDIFGDSTDTALATSAVAEALKMAGNIGAAEQKKKEDAKKAEAATAARKVANEAMQKAQLAQLQAQAETNPAGPLHQAALLAQQQAQVADTAARALEGSAGLGMPVMPMKQEKASSFPTWGYFAIGGGILGVVGLGWMAMRRR